MPQCSFVQTNRLRVSFYKMLIAFYIGVGMIIWLNLANVMFFPPITDQFLHICALFSTNLIKYCQPF